MDLNENDLAHKVHTNEHLLMSWSTCTRLINQRRQETHSSKQRHIPSMVIRSSPASLLHGTIRLSRKIRGEDTPFPHVQSNRNTIPKSMNLTGVSNIDGKTIPGSSCHWTRIRKTLAPPDIHLNRLTNPGTTWESYFWYMNFSMSTSQQSFSKSRGYSWEARQCCSAPYRFRIPRLSRRHLPASCSPPLPLWADLHSPASLILSSSCMRKIAQLQCQCVSVSQFTSTKTRWS